MSRSNYVLYLSLLSLFCVACLPTPQEGVVVTRVTATVEGVVVERPLPTLTLSEVPPTPTPSSTPIASTTPLPISTSTPTFTASPTLHPLFLFDDVTPQTSQLDGLQVAIIPTDDFTDLTLRFTRQAGSIQETSINPLIFGEGNEYPAIGGVTLVAIHDLDLDGEPEIVLDIFTHGLYCCTLIAVLYYDEASEQYVSTDFLTRKWGLSPQTVNIDADGRLEFLTRNEPFHYAIGGATASAAVSPIQIFRYENQAIVDATEQFPELVEEDAQLWLQSTQNELAELSPQYLAELTHENPNYWQEAGYSSLSLTMNAYIADMILLGRGSEGCETIQTYCQNNTCGARQFILSTYEYEENSFCPVYLEEVRQYLEEAAFEGN